MDASTLTPEMVTQLMAQGRDRGGHERFIRKSLSSGAPYTIVTDNPKYKGKDVSQTKNVLTQVVKRIELLDKVSFVKADDETLILVNTELHEAALAEANAQAEASDEA